MKKIILNTFALIILISFTLHGQESETKETPQPLELPRFVIEGVEQLNVQSGIKQFPLASPKLDANYLDSLNSLEKQSSLMLNPTPFPSRTFDNTYKKGFLSASLGSFLTPDLEFGYGLNAGGYELYLNAGAESSQGHIKNSEYQKIYAKITSDYIAPDKYFIFGGSRTRTTVDFNSNEYKFYTADDPFTRNANRLNFKLDVEGNWDGTQFFTGGGFKTLQMDTDVHKSFENLFIGHIKAKNYWRNFLLAGNLELEFGNLRGNSTNFTQLDAALEFFNKDLSVNFGGGLQMHRNSGSVHRGNFIFYSDLEYRLNKIITIYGGFKTGVNNNSYDKLLIHNPYLVHSGYLDYSYDKLALKGYIFIHPVPSIGLTAGMEYKMTDRLPVFLPLNSFTTGEFSPHYSNVNASEAFLEAFWKPNKSDFLVLNLTSYNSILRDSEDKITPYFPNIKSSLKYKKSWFEGFGTIIGLDYVGSRYADLDNKIELDAFINLNAEINYRLSRAFSAMLKLDNLTNSNIYIWEGYKERTVFISLGIMWQF
jgi:hypothetical protein